MCGIFAVLRRPSDRTPPTSDEIGALLDRAVAALADPNPGSALTQAAIALREADQLMRGSAGVVAMVRQPEIVTQIAAATGRVNEFIGGVEKTLDTGHNAADISLESLNAALTEAKDASWALERDRVRTGRAVSDLTGPAHTSNSAIVIYASIQLALSAIDRLEVRGRDSAGVAVMIFNHGRSADEIDKLIADRENSLFLSGAVERSGSVVTFVYKAAAEIGALGDNINKIRQEIQTDALLRVMASFDGAEATVVSHTRWASMGAISEPNAHPVDSQSVDASETPYVVAVHNGDIDNYSELRAQEKLQIADEITTDTKLIPLLVSRRLSQGDAPVEAYRSTVDRFDGSVAIASANASHPDKIYLAVKGSGQGCNIGFAEDAFLVASETYGLVEECSTYLRGDGEAHSNVSGKNGQVFELSRDGAGTLEGLRRFSYGGEDLPVSADEVQTIEVTTRDIDRGGAPHFLLKEISESPQSVRRTLRGKLADVGGQIEVRLPNESLPESVAAALASGQIKTILAIGQGTASIASRTLPRVLAELIPPGVSVVSQPATELSGFGLRDDMSDTLIVAVSQSGTTTDTNRTVDMARARGAKVIAIVNRRQSDLTEKADGVLYTSDGRDVEMSVASTKAFYSQVTALMLLAVAIGQALGNADRHVAQTILRSLRSLPAAMEKVLTLRSEIGEAANKFAPPRRSWAVVGNGFNHIAAQEVRIKMSELCYKSIACDVTEDKKHIDLSAEPMILVCATGLVDSNATDVGKEIAIYNAHKAAPIVIASEGTKFDSAAALITVPSVDPTVDFILSTMAGHLFGYEAALAIDAQGRLLRSARSALDEVIASAGELSEDDLLVEARMALAAPARAILDELRSGRMNGHLETSTAIRLSSLLLYATGVLPLDALEVESGRPTSPSQMLAELLAVLTGGIDELSRPIDAVKHQAKTVTVGISRTEDTFADNELIAEVLGAGAHRDRLTYRSMRTIAALAPAVDEVVGYTRYQVEGDVDADQAVLEVVDRGGIAKDIPSRTETDPRLVGTKHRAAYERIVTVGRGQRDGRSVIIVPEIKDQQITGITLLHTKFKPTLDVATARNVLTGYRNRYSAIVDAVTETEPTFDDARLEQIPTVDLLVEPVWVLAANWRKQ
jgi:glutamine---fructose-6-phosphate transaminase (isomerizing)